MDEHNPPLEKYFSNLLNQVIHNLGDMDKNYNSEDIIDNDEKSKNKHII